MADDDKSLYEDDDEQEGGVFRWMSAIVVLLAVAGFFGLAWYAYKNGGDTGDEKDIEVVKADKAPVKEAPANPGGMDIPNQDKTVYGLISGKNEKPVAEHILAAPEEPLPRTTPEDTQTWMSDSLKGKTAAQVEAMKVGGDDAPKDQAKDQSKEQFNPGKVRTATGAVTTAPAALAAKSSAPAKPPVAAAPAAGSDDSDDSDDDAKPAAKPAVQAQAKPAPAASTTPPSGTRIQLGAYKSQAEADKNWTHIAGKFASEVKSKQHYVVRADLGSKGVYYRLQVAPFASPKDAEQFCLDFVSAGQGCMVAKGK